jgi:hypothetical protein
MSDTQIEYKGHTVKLKGGGLYIDDESTAYRNLAQVEEAIDFLEEQAAAKARARKVRAASAKPEPPAPIDSLVVWKRSRYVPITVTSAKRDSSRYGNGVERAYGMYTHTGEKASWREGDLFLFADQDEMDRYLRVSTEHGDLVERRHAFEKANVVRLRNYPDEHCFKVSTRKTDGEAVFRYHPALVLDAEGSIWVTSAETPDRLFDNMHGLTRALTDEALRHFGLVTASSGMVVLAEDVTELEELIYAANEAAEQARTIRSKAQEGARTVVRAFLDAVEEYRSQLDVWKLGI